MSTCSPWADVGDVCAPCNDYEFDTDALLDWLQVASDALYELTKHRWPGECYTAIRPCARSTCPCFRRHERCSCEPLQQLDLQPYGQVLAIDSVTIDGVTLAPERYELQEGRWLVYLPTGDGDTFRWPTHQRLDRAVTEDDTWQLAYTWGAAPPIGGVKAAAELGCQLALACHPDSTVQSRCRLPKAVTNVVRQGMTVAKPNPAALFPGGQTGLQTVDLWVATVNLGAARRPATVFAPGKLPTYRSQPTA